MNSVVNNQRSLPGTSNEGVVLAPFHKRSTWAACFHHLFANLSPTLH